MRGLWFRTLTQNSKKKFMLLGLLDRPLVWFFAKMSASCLSGHLSARLSPDICINFFFFFFLWTFCMWPEIYKNQGPYLLKKA